MKKSFLRIMFFSLVFVSCTNKNTEQKTEEKPLPVKVMKISETEINKTMELPAIAESWEKVHLVPSSPGKIIKLYVNVGQFVQQGQQVALMDPTQFLSTQLQFEQLTRDKLRMDSLHKLGAISDQQYEQFLTSYHVAQNNYNYLRDNVYLKAPISGIVTAKYYNEGEMFSAAPNTKEGKAALITIEQISPIKINVDVTESNLPYISTKTNVRVSFPSLSDKSFSAQINKIYPTIDPLSRTCRVEISLPNSQNKIKPGMYAVVSIELGKVKGFLIPSIAIQKLQGTAKHYVFKNDKGIARQVFIEKGRTIDNQTEIFSTELNENDEIIIVGQEKVVDGTKINVVK
ncbi:MAG: efflux RND transporter periplasmic adaptor subunit [Bacteroidales bacterium]|nr:efflux RND transporter periplasmic adaptor subunit [Bacteroidales bacterium]